jgi:hypothetical protein
LKGQDGFGKGARQKGLKFPQSVEITDEFLIDGDADWTAGLNRDAMSRDD